MRFINLLISRFKASYGAFKNPQVFYDGEMLMDTVADLYIHQSFCLLTSESHKGHLMPRFEMIPYEMQSAIRRGTGMSI